MNTLTQKLTLIGTLWKKGALHQDNTSLVVLIIEQCVLRAGTEVGKRLSRERVLFIGTRFSNLYTSVDTVERDGFPETIDQGN